MNQNDLIYVIIGIGLVVIALFAIIVVQPQATGNFLVGTNNASFSSQTVTASNGRYINPNDTRTVAVSSAPTSTSLTTTILQGDINDLLPLPDADIANLSWSKLFDFPNGCQAGKAVTGIASNLTCTTFLQSINGLNISDLVNDEGYLTSYTDTNWQTSWGVLDANLRSVFALRSDVNSWGDQRYYTLSNPSNYISKTNADSNYVSRNNWTTIDNYPSACSAGQFVTQIGDTLTCASPTTVIDTNWQTSWGLLDTNLKVVFVQKKDLNADINALINPRGYLTSYTDTNCATNHSCPTIAYQSDVNVWFEKKTDFNSDVNAFGNTRWQPIGNYLVSYVDTNWQTSWGVLDANLRSVFALRSDVNSWGDQRYYGITNPSNFITSSALTNYLLSTDANSFYYKKTDFNYLTFLTSDNDSAYFLTADFNTFGDLRYQLKGSYLSGVDGNAFYYKKTDFNYLTFLTSDDDSAYQRKTDLNADINALINPRNYLTTINGLNISTLNNDSNYQTYTNVLNLLPSSTTYYVSSVDESGSGSIIDSNILLLKYYDSNSMEFNEGTGANPLTVDLNFTGVTEFSQLVIREYYMGSSSHEVQVEIYDYASKTWQSYFSFVGQSGYSIISVPVYDSSEHISAGLTQIRLRHVQNGISSHKLYIDFAWLIKGNNIGASTNLTGYAKYSFGYNNFDGNGNFWTSGNNTATNVYAVDINSTRVHTTGNMVSDANIKANIVNVDTNLNIGSNGYIYDDGSALVIGRR